MSREILHKIFFDTLFGKIYFEKHIYKRISSPVFSSAEFIASLAESLVGIEREALRVDKNGNISQKKHPKNLGNPLTHETITTDYAEAQLEFITPPFTRIHNTLTSLQNIHQEAIKALEEEYLWPMSIPCRLPKNEDDIRIAEYGPSEEGKKREIYRKGLALRYGRQMQTLSGIHYNFSFSDTFWNAYAKENGVEDNREFRNQQYFSLARNFLREYWLLIYLFGSTPLFHESYFCHQKKYPYATSLRVSNCGYSDRKGNVWISWKDLSTHIDDFREAITTPVKEYGEKGLYDGEGNQHQLSTNLLQIENEYYFPIRVKPAPIEGISLLDNLQKNGISYLEIRSLDINPFSPIGIDEQTARFLKVFLLYCLLTRGHDPLQDFTEDDRKDMNHNRQTVSTKGRENEVNLLKNGEEISLHDWGEDIFSELLILGKTMGEKYEQVIVEMQKRLTDISLLPSEKITKEMEEKEENILEFGMRKAKEYKSELS